MSTQENEIGVLIVNLFSLHTILTIIRTANENTQSVCIHSILWYPVAMHCTCSRVIRSPLYPIIRITYALKSTNLYIIHPSNQAYQPCTHLLLPRPCSRSEVMIYCGVYDPIVMSGDIVSPAASDPRTFELSVREALRRVYQGSKTKARARAVG